MKLFNRRKLISLLILAAFFIGGYLLSAWLEDKGFTADAGTAYTDSTAESSVQGISSAPPSVESKPSQSDDAHKTEEDDDGSDVAGPSAEPSSPADNSTTGTDDEPQIDENGSYTSRDDVALYLHIYGRLPENFITKDEARDLGWSGGGLEDYAPGCCIGGDIFGNREGLLPKANGRQYYECDIDTIGKSSRGAKRIVYSNDGLIFYTDDHYASFTQLYGAED